jgi:cytochrome c-type biogenesis protein CcmH/NrfF
MTTSTTAAIKTPTISIIITRTTQPQRQPQQQQQQQQQRQQYTEILEILFCHKTPVHATHHVL